MGGKIILKIIFRFIFILSFEYFNSEYVLCIGAETQSTIYE